MAKIVTWKELDVNSVQYEKGFDRSWTSTITKNKRVFTLYTNTRSNKQQILKALRDHASELGEGIVAVSDIAPFPYGINEGSVSIWYTSGINAVTIWKILNKEHIWEI